MLEPYMKENMKDIKKRFSRIGLSYTFYMAVTCVVQVLGSLVLLLVPILRGYDIGEVWSQAENMTLYMLVSMGLTYAVAFPLFLLVVKMIPAAGRIEKKKWSFAQLNVTFIISMGVVFLGNIIGRLLMYLVSYAAGKTMVNPVNAMISNMNLWTVFLLTVILAPIVEEIMFRKILIDRIIPYGEGVAVVVSGVLFGLAHGNFYQFFYACALGMIFAYVYVKTGRLGYVIGFHMLINFMGSIVPMLFQHLGQTAGMLGLLLNATYGFLLIAFMLAGILLLICYRSHIQLLPGKITIPKGSRFSTIVGNVGMILCVLFCIGLFVIS